MEERKISIEEFDKAVETAVRELLDDPKLEGTTRFMIPLTGTMFASKMRRILFKKGDGTNDA